MKKIQTTVAKYEAQNNVVSKVDSDLEIKNNDLAHLRKRLQIPPTSEQKATK